MSTAALIKAFQSPAVRWASVESLACHVVSMIQPKLHKAIPLLPSTLHCFLEEQVL